jgi:hypothetical protein
MWDIVGIVAAVVVIILMFQLLDVTDALRARLRGGSTTKDLEARINSLEERVTAMEKKIP